MSPIGLWAQAACIWEATARKAGNVHRYCDFADSTYLDFLLSAAAIAPVLDQAAGRKVGVTIREAVLATRRVVAGNTNLGIILLLAPLAAVPEGVALRAGLASILDQLDVEDARLAYEAIRLAVPGGLGKVAEQDIGEPPTATLRQVMALAAGRDLVARQYATNFTAVWDDGVPLLQERLEHGSGLEEAIIHAHLGLMARYPDTLIARKRGATETEESARRAQQVLQLGWPNTPAGGRALEDLDAWLRAAGNQRNPGTTADLIAASLFVMLREGHIVLRVQW
jgi:triphosphoribosyl-dephospho-CoA synthase